MEKPEAEAITADGVVQADVEVTKTESKEVNPTAVTKWKWVWRGICYVAEAVLEDEPTAEGEISVEAMDTGDEKDIPTSSGLKRKVVINAEQSEEPTEKKPKES